MATRRAQAGTSPAVSTTLRLTATTRWTRALPRWISAIACPSTGSGHPFRSENEEGASWNVASSFNNATFNGNYALDKGSSTLDQRHRVSINWVWSPILTSSTSAFAKYLVNGWELSVIR